jgi:ketosteroid isomerase-like protein
MLGSAREAGAQQPAAGVPRGSEDEAALAANRRVIERYCSAWLAGNVPALVGCYHDQFTLHYAGSNPFSGQHVGKAAALAVLAEVGRRSGRRLLSIVDCMAGPARAVVIAREAFERNGARAELERVFVYTVKDDRLHECWAYDFDQPTVDRLLRD